jgi:hypothetical protein
MLTRWSVGRVALAQRDPSEAEVVATRPTTRCRSALGIRRWGDGSGAGPRAGGSAGSPFLDRPRHTPEWCSGRDVPFSFAAMWMGRPLLIGLGREHPPEIVGRELQRFAVDVGETGPFRQAGEQLPDAVGDDLQPVVRDALDRVRQRRAEGALIGIYAGEPGGRPRRSARSSRLSRGLRWLRSRLGGLGRRVPQRLSASPAGLR